MSYTGKTLTHVETTNIVRNLASINGNYYFHMDPCGGGTPYRLLYPHVIESIIVTFKAIGYDREWLKDELRPKLEYGFKTSMFDFKTNGLKADAPNVVNYFQNRPFYISECGMKNQQYLNEARTVYSPFHSVGADNRFVMVDIATKKIVLDANGYGYSTPAAAYKAYQYKKTLERPSTNIA